MLISQKVNIGMSSFLLFICSKHFLLGSFGNRGFGLGEIWIHVDPNAPLVILLFNLLGSMGS